MKQWIVLLFFCFPGLLFGDEITLGVGGFYSSLPHYLGAEQNEGYWVPLPYIHVEKEHYKIERNEFESFYEIASDHYFSVTAGGAIAVASDKNDARKGMNDLAWVGEIGPSYQFYAYGSPKTDNYLYLSPFWRKAYAFDSRKVDDIGSVYGAMLEAGHQFYQTDSSDVSLTLRIATRFGSAAYNRYFYQVSPHYVTPQRPAYRADSGYLTTVLSLGVSYDNPWLWAGSFVRYYNYSHSANAASPLLRDNHNVAFGIGFAWKFYTFKN